MARPICLYQPALFFVIISIHFHGVLSRNHDANTTDHLALLAIKAEIKEDPQSIMNSWNESRHFCLWRGVTCGRRHKRVTVLDLNSKGLVGSLSPFIGNLSFLRVINLHNNTFHGQIPPEIGRLFRLQDARLDSNSFDGKIPSNFSHCSNLRVLALRYNKLSESIPTELGSLSSLTVFALDNLTLTGGIPPFIGNLTSLEVISFSDCHLGGHVPDVFSRLPRIKTLYLGNNDLVGTIPPSIYNLSSLTHFSVFNNLLHGSIPTNIGSMLPHLQIFQLTYNNLTGALPASISNCTELQEFEVGMNDFSGKIAIDFGNLKDLSWLVLGDARFGSGESDEMMFIDSLTNCSNLVAVELQSNQLTGALPDSVGNLSKQLDYLGLYRNRLYGTIPSSIGDLLSLTILDLADNRITGTIPQSISKLQNLQWLKLNTNFLSGNIPDSLGNLSSLLNFDLSQNNLEGSLDASVGNWQKMTSLWFFQNNLNGTIPKQLFSLSSLSIVLDLSQNHFSGPIPSEVENFKNLGIFSLAENDLSGELPDTIGRCTSLEFLDLGGNLFNGSIPSSLAYLTGLQELNLSNNNFSGQIPVFLEKIPFTSLDLSNNDFAGEMPTMGVFANASSISVVGNDRLCGGISQLQLPKCRVSRHRKFPRAIKIIIPLVSALLFASLVSFLVFCWRTRARKNHKISLSAMEAAFMKVSYERLLKATDGFSETNLIGRGSYSSVYKGILEEGGIHVAVKVLNLEIQGGSKSFFAECEALRNIRHRNLVKVVTSCSSIDYQGNDFKAIVYEFMSNGSLESWLHSGVRTALGLRERLNIAMDVASAVDYLHQHCGKTIVHCDLKPSNILLDDDMVAHVGDFGLAKLILTEVSNANRSSSIGVRGTIGYAAPEYGLGGEASVSGDIYSYGILLLEMVTGKRPTDATFQGNLDLHSYANTALAGKSGIHEIVDPTLLNDNTEDVKSLASSSNISRHSFPNRKTDDENCLLSLIKIGVACSMESPKDRMSMSNVIHDLQSLRRAIL